MKALPFLCPIKSQLVELGPGQLDISSGRQLRLQSVSRRNPLMQMEQGEEEMEA